MQKVSMFCHVTPKQVMGVHNVSSTYHVPLLMQDQGLIDFLTKRLDLASISITKELKQYGQDLSVRWKALTSGYVFLCGDCLGLVMWLTLV
jgi:CTP synthase